MASKLYDHNKRHTNYGRMSRMIVELCRDALWELLCGKIPAKDLPNKIMSNIHKLKLSPDDKAAFDAYNKTGGVPVNTDVDVSAVYTILRNICPKKQLKPPTNGWGKPPASTDVKNADDIERIREIRNKLYGHIKEAQISDSDYKDSLNTLREVMKRFDGCLKSQFSKFLIKLDQCCMDPEMERQYIDSVERQKQNDEETRDMLGEAQKDISDLKGQHDEMLLSIDSANDRMDLITEQQMKCKKEVLHVKKQQELQEGGTNVEIALNQTIGDISLQGKKNQKTKDFKTERKETSHNIPKKQTTFKKTSNVSIRTDVKEPNIVRTASECNQNINVNNQINVSINTGVSESDHSHGTGFQFQSLRKAIDGFKNGHFILIASQVERKKYMQDFALVPWSVVFDLDQNSKNDGLLSVVEDKLNSQRSLYVHTFHDQLSNITETSTHWMFARGSSKHPDSLMKNDIRSWNKDPDVNVGMSALLQNLSNFSEYTQYRVIVLWPSDQFMPAYIQRILELLDKEIEPSIVIIDDNSAMSQEANTTLSAIKEYFKESITHIKLNLEDVCKVIHQSLGDNDSQSYRKYQLPTSDHAENTEIDDQRASWLQENMDVLFLDKQTSSRQISSDNLSKECETFYKGGTLPWWIWYELGAGHVDAERDLMQQMLSDIRKHIGVYKSGTVTLYHAPGSGGTTLAQRILWELRKEVPCVQASIRSGYSINELQHRLEFIYKKTDLPIILLLDGEEEQRLDDLIKEAGHITIIALCVKRYLYPMEKKAFHNGSFWLHGYVSRKEANVITLKLQQQCKEDKTKLIRLNNLNNQVKRGKQRAIFEFGLAAYSYEYKGIETYVNGFLQLEKCDTKLESWQNALGMLALTYYYGQVGIPCRFFEKMLNLTDIDRVTTIQEFPVQMQALIVRDLQEGKKNMIRISHFYIAKEILEQILPWPHARTIQRDENLCLEQRSDLEKFAVWFIKKSAHQYKSRPNGFMIASMLTKTFISRDFKFLGGRDCVQQKRREQVSHLLIDLENKHPYTARFTVLQTLVDSFPDHPPYLAQLGRLYILYRPEMEEEAEKCFKKALKLCESKTGGKQLEDIPRSMRLTMMMTNHMYGQMFEKRIEKFTGRYFKAKPEQRTNQEKFPEVANAILQNVKSACSCFQFCRKYNPNSQGDINAFRGEINVRLKLCDFVQKRGGCNTIARYISQNEHTEISEFVNECCYEIDALFLECFSTINNEDIDESFLTNQRWYTTIFKKSTAALLQKKENSMQGRRVFISQLKLEAGTEKIYGVLDNIDSESKILEIIKAYELNFDEAIRLKDGFSRLALDIDYREWLVAIRHKTIRIPYEVTEVLKVVENWYEKLKTPQSRFYLFILKSLLGFGTIDIPGNTVLLLEAQRLRDDVTKHRKYVEQSKHPYEWFGKGVGICRLVMGTRFFGLTSRTLNTQDLEVMQGTICHPNKKQRSGVIDLDIGSGNRVAVKVFFLPIRAKMEGPSYAGNRVEFNVAFSFFNGYEAFNLRSLDKKTCPECGIKIEVSSREKIKICPKPCGFRIILT